MPNTHHNLPTTKKAVHVWNKQHLHKNRILHCTHTYISLVVVVKQKDCIKRNFSSRKMGGEEAKEEKPAGDAPTGEGGEKLSKNQLKKLAKGKVRVR
jgi:hypothetical protein